MTDGVCKLLQRLWDLNEEDGIRQSRTDPSGSRDEIATLDAARTVRLSPMLKARYAFAGTWRKAALDQTWLDYEDIGDAVIKTRMSREAHAQIAARGLPWKISGAQATLFGIRDDTSEATYLIWRPGHAEPAICACYGGRSDLFRDLERFLEFLTGGCLHDDSIELAASAAAESGSVTSRETI